MPDDTKFYPGTLVFDRKRTDPTDDPLVITDANVGTLGEISDDETYRLVKYNDVNQQLKPGPNEPLGDNTPIVEAAYVTDEDDTPAVVEREAYTFPEFRLQTVVSKDDGALDGERPHQVALAQFYAELATALRETETIVTTPHDLKLLAMKADVDGTVIVRGEDRMLDARPTS